MRRVCKYCGREYEGDPNGVCCPDCAAAQRKTSIRERVCCVCGKTFPGGPSARYCPECRRERQKEINRRHKKNGPARKLGSTDLCAVCGNPYIVASGLQKYCKDCAAEAIRKRDNERSLEWNRANTTPEQRRLERNRAIAQIPCVICGKLFTPRPGGNNTCSPECSQKRRKQKHAEWEKAHSEERNRYHCERLKRNKNK